MRSNIIKSPLLLAFPFLLLVAGCSKKFGDYSQNKNLPLSVPAGLSLRAVIGDIIVYPGGFEDKANQFIASNYTYYGDNKYWTGSASLNYSDLNNVIAMEATAKKAANGDKNPYYALGLFLRAFFFVSMSEKVGDLPMTEALQGKINPTPKYDKQKDIFKQCLVWLDSANSILAEEIPIADLAPSFYEFSGDYYYKERIANPLATNDALKKWQKVINTLRLRMLIGMSKKVTTDADLNIPQQFAAIVNNPAQYPIFTSNDDNLQYVYNSSFNYYPDNPGNYGNNAGRLNLGSTLETTLGQLHDLRAMVLGEPAEGLGFKDTAWESFVGAQLGADLSVLSTLSGGAKLSLYNYHHFYATYTAEPTIILGYGEACLNVAEGINRGWASGDAKTWYESGIKGMFDFYGIKDGINTVYFVDTTGKNLTYNVHFNFSDYFSQGTIAYKGNTPDGLKQILIQKYLSYARNSGLQAYYQWRRTGVPTFSVGAGTGNGGKVPLRFQYPNGEAVANATNYAAALQNQYNGTDDINAQMWLIK
jgi:hypothetical protein